MIQQAHKKADKGFNDIVAQLYDEEFKTQEKAKYEHIRQAEEKAIEEQRISEEKRAEDDRIARENSQKSEQTDVKATQGISRGDEAPNEAINGSIWTDWSQVSPEIAANYMSSKTPTIK